MRRVGVLVSVVAVMLPGMLALHAQPVAIAQEASPAADGMGLEGVTFEPLAITSGLTIPSPADMIALRFSMEPGAVLPIEASDPSSGMLIVESGTLTVRVDADWVVSRSGALNAAIGTAVATGTFTPSDERIASGEEVTMSAGDAAYIPRSVSGEIRNDGQEPAMGLVVLVGPSETMSGATPTP